MEEKELQSAGLNALDQQPEQPVDQAQEEIGAWPSVDEHGRPVAEGEQVAEEQKAPQENIQQETQETLAQETQVHSGRVQQQEPSKPMSNKDYNMIMLREEREQYQRERDELARRLAEYEKAQQPQEEESLPEVGDGELVEGKHLSKMGKELKKIKQELAQYQQTAQVNAIEQQVRSSYPDFDKVVTPEAIEELKKRYPSVAATIYQSNDLYNKAASAYDLIKSLGIHKDPVKFEVDKAKIEQNLQKPRVAATLKPQTGTNPLDYANAFANGLTDDLKDKLNREMAEYSRMG
jgi:hypothetical protein